MAEKEKITGMKLVTLVNTKEGFLTLCQQYARMGHLMKVLAKSIDHPTFSKTAAPYGLKRILDQYYEVGEQLKVVGMGLDDLGGSGTMGKKKDFPKPKLKREPKPFVANIPPEKKTTTTKKKKDEKEPLEIGPNGELYNPDRDQEGY